MNYRVFSIALVIIGLCSAFAAVHEDLHKAMMKMMQKMKSMKMTGNADHDFAMMMAEHHQGSIDASQIVLKSGQDTKIKSMAQSIVDKQTQEQKQLRAHKTNGEDHSAHARNEEAAGTNKSSDANASTFNSEMKQAMDEMESSMKSMTMSKNVDHDFATMMIPHHQSAIDMSDAILKHGKDQQIKDMAQKIKSDSQKEIDELKSWLENHGK